MAFTARSPVTLPPRDRMMVDIREVGGGGFLSRTPMNLMVHRSVWVTFCGGLMSPSPPVEPHQAVLPSPLLLVKQN